MVKPHVLTPWKTERENTTIPNQTQSTTRPDHVGLVPMFYGSIAVQHGRNRESHFLRPSVVSPSQGNIQPYPAISSHIQPYPAISSLPSLGPIAQWAFHLAKGVLSSKKPHEWFQALVRASVCLHLFVPNNLTEHAQFQPWFMTQNFSVEHYAGTISGAMFVQSSLIQLWMSWIDAKVNEQA